MYFVFPAVMSSTERLKSLFVDLGKPTLRGVRKCPKCGTFNGTRGVSCKNKTCDVVFKETPERKKAVCVDAVKIMTGSTAQVFSVRVRDRGPDYRGFVQLPLLPSLDSNAEATVDASLLTQTTARCFVETCQKINSSASDNGINPCQHIKAAAICFTDAQPLTLKNSVLNALQVSNEIKQAIWLLATETTGPLVQRVSKNIMVVKCKPNPKHPLGFLHFAFFETSRNREAPEHKFHCSCRAFKNLKTVPPKEESQKRCVHFYACVCAFASNDKLADEFAFYINMDALGVVDGQDNKVKCKTFGAIISRGGQKNYGTSNLRKHLTCMHPARAEELDSLTENDAISSPPGPRQQQQTIGALIDKGPERSLVTIYSVPSTDQTPCGVEILESDSPSLLSSQPKKRKRDDTLVQASNALLTLQDGTNTPNKKNVTKKAPDIAGCKKPNNVPIDEVQVSITFHQWLASVTERINQTMHYQFDGNPEPLVFHAPQVFFDCLQQRISTGSKKKRLPNSTTGFVRKDALPLGTFSKYTWQITNIMQVKQIFDTAEMPLEVLRSFVENRDGTFDLYEPPKSQLENGTESFRKTDHQPLIKPFELKTFLKVGTTSSEQKEPTPFIIEWIPDILPKMKIGELRIKFEYGHQRNGSVEHRSPPTPHIIQIQSL